MAIPIIFVFVDKILSTVKNNKKDLLKLFELFILFGIISLPIGLWHPIRNKILFGQSIGGVMFPSQIYYIGNYSFFDRFIKISFKELFTTYCTIPGDYNIPAFIIKTSLFGEWEWNYNIFLVNSLKVINIIIIGISLFAIIWKVAVDKNVENRILDRILAITWVTNIISYIAFNIEYPYTCTMDFRYLVPTIFTGMYFIGGLLNGLKDSKMNKRIIITIGCTIVVFAMLSVACGL